MRRSTLSHHFLHLEPIEYRSLTRSRVDLAWTLVSAAMAAIPVTHPDQRQACRDWLNTLAPNQAPGWMTCLAELLLAAREPDSPMAWANPDADATRLLQAAYVLAADLTCAPHRATGPVLAALQQQGISRRSTKRAALKDIITQLQAVRPQYSPPPALARNLTPAPHPRVRPTPRATSRTKESVNR